MAAGRLTRSFGHTMNAELNRIAAREHLADLRRSAERSRHPRRRPRVRRMPWVASLLLRLAS